MVKRQGHDEIDTHQGAIQYERTAYQSKALDEMIPMVASDYHQYICTGGKM